MKSSSDTSQPGRRQRLLAAALLLAAGSVAQAASLADQGKQIYTQGGGGVPACVGCHGAKGEGQAAANFPFLAGQGNQYLDEQLQAFASGSRDNAIMKPVASGLSADQRKAVIAYIGTLPASWDAAKLGALAQTYPDSKDAGAWLANRGDWSQQVPACIQCHAAGGVGVGAQFPALAGLSKTYIIEQFNLWRSGKRQPGPGNLMGEIAKRLSEKQVEAVATYFAALPQAAAGKEAK